MTGSLRRSFSDATAEVRVASVRTLRRSVRVLLLHRRGNQRGDIALKRLSVVVLDFWAPWCVPCRTSFPAMDALQRKYEKQGLRVLGLTLDANDDAIIAFLNAVPVGFTILRDASGQAGEAFNVVAMPTTFVFDREGRIAARFEGGGAVVHAKVEAA